MKTKTPDIDSTEICTPQPASIGRAQSKKVIAKSPTFAATSAGAIEAGKIIRGRNEAVFQAQLRFAVWLLAAKELAKAETRTKKNQGKESQK